MIREQVLGILYEMAIAIGGETRVRPLLTTTLQRLLFHTSFPCGLIFLDPARWRAPEDGAGMVEARLDLSIGDFELGHLQGTLVRVPAELLRGEAELAERPQLLDSLPCRKGRYRAFLRLPIDARGVILLLGPEMPSSPLPLARMFEPVLRNLAKAIVLCEGSEAYTQGLLSDRAKAEAAFQDLSYRSELVLASVGEGICGIDLAGEVTFVNPAAVRLLGYGLEELAGRPLHEVILHRKANGREIPPEVCPLGLAMREGLPHRTDEDSFRRKDGTDFPVEYVCTPLREGHRVLGAVVVFQDIGARRQAEKELRKLNRALQRLSRCNMSLVHARDESSLLGGICSALVDIGGYTMVWVGYAEPGDGRPIRAVAQAGMDDGYLAAFPVTWDGSCTCPFGLAVRAGEPVLVQDLRQSEDPSPWRAEALRRGFASCLALPLRPDGPTVGTLVLFNAEPEAFTKDEVRLLEELAEDLSFGIANLRTRSERDRAVHERAAYLERLRKVAVDTVQAISAIVELRDPYTAGHQKRVAQLAAAISRELGLPEERIEGIRFGSLIHDIGKIYVPAEFLNRPGQLTDLELQVIKTHTRAGYAIVKDIDFPWPVAQMIHQHHELLDGSGYPLGLKGSEIILEARILAVADVLEAMVSHRPYRPARGLDVALAELEGSRGKLYDEAAVRACLALFVEERFAFS